MRVVPNCSRLPILYCRGAACSPKLWRCQHSCRIRITNRHNASPPPVLHFAGPSIVATTRCRAIDWQSASSSIHEVIQVIPHVSYACPSLISPCSHHNYFGACRREGTAGIRSRDHPKPAPSLFSIGPECHRGVYYVPRRLLDGSRIQRRVSLRM